MEDGGAAAAEQRAVWRRRRRDFFRRKAQYRDKGPARPEGAGGIGAGRGPGRDSVYGEAACRDGPAAPDGQKYPGNHLQTGRRSAVCVADERTALQRKSSDRSAHPAGRRQSVCVGNPSCGAGGGAQRSRYLFDVGRDGHPHAAQAVFRWGAN